ELYRVENNWTELGVTYATRPALISGLLGDAGEIVTNTWVEYDVTSLVTANGDFSFMLISPNTDGVSFASRESGIPAELVLTIGSGSSPTNTPTPTATNTSLPPTNTPTPTATNTPMPPTNTPTPTATLDLGTSLTFYTNADAYVRDSKPTWNYGDSTTFWVDGGGGPIYESFLGFAVSGVSNPIQSAVLRVYGTTNTGNGPELYGVENTWTELGVTYATRPALISGLLGDAGEITTNTWVEYDVTSFVTANGDFSFMLISPSTDGVSFASRESGLPAELVLTFAP
ncbi:MAG: DNRLRE domain-containing protein, partial [Anaerolineales bacterium]